MGDNRFKMMFEDEEFKRDPRLEAQKSYVSITRIVSTKIDLLMNFFRESRLVAMKRMMTRTIVTSNS